MGEALEEEVLQARASLEKIEDLVSFRVKIHQGKGSKLRKPAVFEHTGEMRPTVYHRPFQ